jgi:hypothetical protein
LQKKLKPKLVSFNFEEKKVRELPLKFMALLNAKNQTFHILPVLFNPLAFSKPIFYLAPICKNKGFLVVNKDHYNSVFLQKVNRREWHIVFHLATCQPIGVQFIV